MKYWRSVIVQKRKKERKKKNTKNVSDKLIKPPCSIPVTLWNWAFLLAYWICGNLLFSGFNLQMNTSGGGGFCDCGDAEAWKDGVACDSHQHVGDTDMEEVQYFSNLLTNITQQAEGVYQKW